MVVRSVLFMGVWVGMALLMRGFPAEAMGLTQREVQVGISDVFVPGGFDSSSDAYVVASGVFPNGCYYWKGATVDHLGLFKHEVRTFATVTEGLCIMVLVPFTKEIPLGRLSSGSHTVKFLGGDGTYLEKDIVIE